MNRAEVVPLSYRLESELSDANIYDSNVTRIVGATSGIYHVVFS